MYSKVDWLSFVSALILTCVVLFVFYHSTNQPGQLESQTKTEDGTPTCIFPCVVEPEAGNTDQFKVPTSYESVTFDWHEMATEEPEWRFISGDTKTDWRMANDGWNFPLGPRQKLFISALDLLPRPAPNRYAKDDYLDDPSNYFAQNYAYGISVYDVERLLRLYDTVPAIESSYTSDEVASATDARTFFREELQLLTKNLEDVYIDRYHLNIPKLGFFEGVNRNKGVVPRLPLPFTSQGPSGTYYTPHTKTLASTSTIGVRYLAHYTQDYFYPPNTTAPYIMNYEYTGLAKKDGHEYIVVFTYPVLIDMSDTTIDASSTPESVTKVIEALPADRFTPRLKTLDHIFETFDVNPPAQ